MSLEVARLSSAFVYVGSSNSAIEVYEVDHHLGRNQRVAAYLVYMLQRRLYGLPQKKDT